MGNKIIDAALNKILEIEYKKAFFAMVVKLAIKNLFRSTVYVPANITRR